MSVGIDGLVKMRGCTPIGEYKCQIPMPLNGRRHDVDWCIADIVTALNAANIRTGMVGRLVSIQDRR